MEQTATHWKKMADPEYYGSHDLINPDGTYREITVTITGVTRKEIIGNAGKKDTKNILLLKEVKPIVLNNINQKAISRAVGSPFVERWVGKQVTIYVEVGVRAFGGVTDALRFRSNTPAVAPVDRTAELAGIASCASLDALRDYYMGLPGEAKNDPAVVAAKDARKEALTKNG